MITLCDDCGKPFDDGDDLTTSSFEHRRDNHYRCQQCEEGFALHVAEAAKHCRCCPSCSNPPCDGSLAGGVCDQMSSCRCFDDRDDALDDPQSSDDLDAEGEAT